MHGIQRQGAPGVLQIHRRYIFSVLPLSPVYILSIAGNNAGLLPVQKRALRPAGFLRQSPATVQPDSICRLMLYTGLEGISAVDVPPVLSG